MHYAQLEEVWRELTAHGAPFELETSADLRVFRQAPRDLAALWASTAAFADSDYLVFEGERITYSQAHRHVDSVAAWLAAQGVVVGDRVGIAMRNYPEWMLAYWAALRLGAVVVGFNAWWSGAELAFGLADATPKVLFADAERISRLMDHSSALTGVQLVAVRARDAPPTTSRWTEIVAGFSGAPEATIVPDADACIFYTSGTTGTPKGARLTHRGCVNNLMNLLFAGRSQTLAMQRARGEGEAQAAVTPPSALITTPLFHVTANNCVAHTTTLLGGKLVLMHRWDPGVALALIEQEHVTSLSAVPVIARELVSHPDFERYDTSSLGSLGGGGAPLHPELLNRIEQTAQSARAQTGYGMTEASGAITSIIGDFFQDKPTSCGRPLPTYDLEIRDDAGAPLPQGEVGEVWVRSCTVIAGYLNRPAETADAIINGWLRTGDVGQLDPQGFLHLVDRKKDMVLRGGENVYCAEVEAALHRHPSVRDCCVFGIPDSRLGEEVAAAVFLHPERSETETSLQAHCGALIASFKTPKRIWILDAPLPRNATGKVLKAQLREMLLAVAS